MRTVAEVTGAHVTGVDVPQMTHHQVTHLREQAILTATFVCEA